MTGPIRHKLPVTPKPGRVAMLIYPGVTPLDVTGPLQVFDLANHSKGTPFRFDLHGRLRVCARSPR